jgi:Meiotically up-regulated gene 113
LSRLRFRIGTERRRGSRPSIIGPQRPRAPVKIGFSTTPAQRLDALRTSHHEDLFILAHGPGRRVEEHALHQMFASARLRGEWFRRTWGINNLIDFLNGGGIVSDLIAHWEATQPTPVGHHHPVLERFMRRQVTKRAKKVKYNGWDAICSPAGWQEHFEDGRISATAYARTLASLVLAPNITEAEKADIEMRQRALIETAEELRKLI